MHFFNAKWERYFRFWILSNFHRSFQDKNKYYKKSIFIRTSEKIKNISTM
ncbi:hypothetical protein LEP1GSC193_2259 [Leptospira alstonii serovar Pingchang str. 80-412]|uniref:Uncharacterized protein n=2 Tax=Leptospira alstonii TaxID=28452 RepID=M6CW55_9LEPT|nr:hypothetical protein LEP1GSC194_0337 [Leptospira alstonii serovar Sichuan str. 79601]EQA79958.1 hypothetical protein LEP1GSC193_2259 [Leptospira alstonii serovar Pingchang str. 80-412]